MDFIPLRLELERRAQGMEWLWVYVSGSVGSENEMRREAPVESIVGQGGGHELFSPVPSSGWLSDNSRNLNE